MARTKYNIKNLVLKWLKEAGINTGTAIEDLLNFFAPGVISNIDNKIQQGLELDEQRDEIVKELAKRKADRTSILNYLISKLNDINSRANTSSSNIVRDAVSKTKKKLNEQYDEQSRIDAIKTAEENRILDQLGNTTDRALLEKEKLEKLEKKVSDQ